MVLIVIERASEAAEKWEGPIGDNQNPPKKVGRPQRGIAKSLRHAGMASEAFGMASLGS